MAYESPITIVERITRSATEEMEDTITRTVSLQYGVTVNKEELKKALLYDRGQYDKGYEDALVEVRERVEMAKAEINRLKECQCPFADEYANGVHDGFGDALKVIKQYLGEVEHENEK